MKREAAGAGSFREHLAGVNLSGARTGFILAAALMPAGALLDLIEHGNLALSFASIRLASSAAAVTLLGVSYMPWARRHPVLLGAGPPLICATAIEVMIEWLGGYASPYYAGLNLCILSVGVLYTWHWRHAALVCGAILAMWAAPALPAAVAGHFELRGAFNNFYFLLTTSMISIASSVLRHRLAEREFDARSEQARTSAELASTLERLQQLDRLKNEFFANISHELRTPLTLILAPVEQILSSSPASPHATELGIVRRNADRLLRMIDDLLDLARLESGGLRLNVALVEPSDLAEKIVECARPAAFTRSIDLAFESEGSVENIYGDPHRIEIVITNLVGNALKFTPPGGHVKVRVKPERGGVRIEVLDDGQGIAAKDIDRIFDRFYQVEGSERREHGGAGIGLALARELVNLHGGKLTVTSTEGRGSTFRVFLPGGKDRLAERVVERRKVRAAEHPSRRAEDVTPSSPPLLSPVVAPVPFEVGAERIVLDRGRRPRILVAEDEADLRSFIRGMFESDFEVITAKDGHEAFELVKKERPDVVISDVMMPGMSGTDVCRAIKQDPSLSRTPVILLTARSGSNAALDGYSAGADDFVAKPFHTRVLAARVRAQLRLRAMSLRLAQHARLSLAGTLAGGVAHEVRNPLHAIINAVDVLRREQRGETDTHRNKLLSVIDNASERILGIVNALDDHVRPADAAAGHVPHDVRAGVESTLQLLEYRMAGIQVHREFTTARCILAPPREFNQVLMNLIENAVRAKPESIWIRVQAEGSKVCVHVADDGPGVPPDIAEHIFDPFFTTRPVGEGTGLGLYLSRGIVASCGGELRLQGRNGGGAEFVIEMPAEGGGD